MIKIGDFSKLSQISIRMLRHYDEMGLLHPESVDAFTGYRYYTVGQLSEAFRITMLKQMGFSLSAIRTIIDSYSRTEDLVQYLQVQLEQTKQELFASQERLQLIETAITRLRKDESMMKYDVTVKEMPARYVASLRRIIPAYDKEGLLWNQMREETEAHGIKMEMAHPPFSAAIFHDADFKETDPDVEIQFAVVGEYPDTEYVHFKTESPVFVASAVYTGSYDMITDAYRAVAEWVNANGYAFNGPMFAIYHTSPACESDPNKLVTEVCFPVQKQ